MDETNCTPASLLQVILDEIVYANCGVYTKSWNILAFRHV